MTIPKLDTGDIDEVQYRELCKQYRTEQGYTHLDYVSHNCCGNPLLIYAKSAIELEIERERWTNCNTICHKCLWKDLTS